MSDTARIRARLDPSRRRPLVSTRGQRELEALPTLHDRTADWPRRDLGERAAAVAAAYARGEMSEAETLEAMRGLGAEAEAMEVG